MVRVRVRGSPYRAVSIGRKGQVISRQRMSPTYDQADVKFEDGATWHFDPDELERLDGSPL